MKVKVGDLESFRRIRRVNCFRVVLEHYGVNGCRGINGSRVY